MGDADQPSSVDPTRATGVGASEAPLALEDYAAMCAEVDAGVQLDEVLEHRGTSREAWAASHAHWLRRMNDEAERKRLALTTRYQATFKAKRAVFEARLRRERARADRAKVAPLDTAAMVAAERELSAPLVSSLAHVSLPDAPPRAPVATPSAARPMPSGLGGLGEARGLTDSSALPPRGPAPVAAMLVGQMPVGQMPIAPMPVGQMPVGQMPVGQMPIGQRPVGQTPGGQLNNEQRPMGSAAAGSQSLSATMPPMSEAPSTAPAGASHGDSLPFRPTPQPQPAVRAGAPDAGPPRAPAPGITKKPDWSHMTADISSVVQQVVAAIPFREGASSSPVSSPPSTTPTPAPAISPAAPPKGASGGKPKHLYATMGVDYGAMAQNALPFQDRGVPPAPPPPKGLGETRPPDTAAPATQKTPSTPPPAHASEPPRRVESELGRTGTIDPDIIKNALAGGVPFAKRAEASRAAQSSPPAANPTASPNASPTASPNANPNASATGNPGASPTASRFPINVFASLTAEIAEQPANAAAIRARYGVTEEVHREESARWTAAFERDPALRERYFGIVKRYRAYLQTNKK